MAISSCFVEANHTLPYAPVKRGVSFIRKVCYGCPMVGKSPYSAEYIQSLIAKYGSIRATHVATGICRKTLSRHLRKSALPHGLTINSAPIYDKPYIPSPDKPIEDVVNEAVSNFNRLYKHKAATKWMRFTMRESGPFMLMFVGDPHLDDNGCNWPLLRDHHAIMKCHPRILPVGLGDYTNNWIGKLAIKKYPDQKITETDAWRLAEYFIQGVNWLLLISGNHDMWSGNKDPLKWITAGHIYEQWQARFELEFPNGRTCRIHAAHDMKGHSQWNPLHGPMKREQLSGSNADIYVAGDKHNWITTRYENAVTGKTPVMIRARGYKFIDEYAEMLGYESQQSGASMCVVIDPDCPTTDWMMTFSDPVKAADYLAYKLERGGYAGASDIMACLDRLGQ